MTFEEFKTWFNDFRSRFPDAGGWIASSDQKAMRQLWYDEIFRMIELRDCMAANQAIMAGTKPKWKDFNREGIASHIKDVSELIAIERVHRLEAARKRSEYAKRRSPGWIHQEFDDGKSMSHALAQVRGMSRADRRAWLDDYFGSEGGYSTFDWREATPEEKQRYAATRAGLRGDTVSEEQAANELRQKLAEISD